MKKILVILIVTASFLVTGAAFAETYPEGMVSYWKFDDCTAVDSVGVNNGTISGATCTTGRVGEALWFSGYDYVVVSDHESLNPSYITVEAWVYPTNYGYVRAFVTKKYHSGWAPPWFTYQISFFGYDPNANSAVRVNYDYAEHRIRSTNPLLINAWNHVAGTYDGETLKIYINGNLEGENTAPSGPIDSQPTPLYIGHVQGTNNYFYGKIDEVAIYNRALTGDEIQQHYQNGLNGQGYELPSVTQLNCIGFEPPMAAGPVTVKKNRALPHKANLLDADGLPVTDADIAAPPVIQVLYQSGTGEAAIDVTDDALAAGEGTEGNQFICTEDEKWQFNLKTKNYSASGTYTVSMQSGDETEYGIVEPMCEATFVIK
jgi:hypothetical protein